MILLFIIVVFVCLFVYMFDREITFLEFLGMFLITFVAVGIVYSLQFIPISNSVYFESGRLMQVRYYPKFVEEYEERHEVCHGNDEDRYCYTYYTTEHVTHPEHWMTFDSLGRSWKIDKSFYETVRKDFGSPKFEILTNNRCTHGGRRVSGDSKTYLSKNATNTYNYPVSVQKDWHNPIIGTKSIFNTNSDIKFEYPETDGYFYNTRLMTAPGLTFTSKDWDIFNTKIYEANAINANLFAVASHEDCASIEAKWTGGGKNDYNICVVGPYNKPEYVKVFGWSSNLYGIAQLEALIAHEGITKSNLVKIQDLMIHSYVPTDFSQFDYIKRVCPLWVNVLAIIVAIISCAATYANFSSNWDRKE